MSTPPAAGSDHTEPAACAFARQFQQQDLSECSDYALLAHSKAHLHNKLLQKKYFIKQLQQLYTQLDKTRNYQEFEDALLGHCALLREIFALERGNHIVRQSPTIDWHKYGLDVEAYLLAQDDAATRALVHNSGWVFHDM